MHFVHRPSLSGETIAAIATPPGEGGVAIIRISGHTAEKVANFVFSKEVSKIPSHTLHYGSILSADGSKIDTGLLAIMRAPRSYTGEDVVEIHCHGGSLISRRVLQAVLASGARAAEPGEFTLRAFLNGKMDLAQAEAVQELICAKNEHALDAAGQQLRGALSSTIQSFQSTLTGIAAILEAWVDFPEEGLEFASMEDVCADLYQVEESMSSLLKTFHDGRIIHEGISLCLVGRPNVGKSSLMNALLERERAIVTEIAGTTRDIVEGHLRLNGLNLKIIDTAGIRETEEIVEKEGIRRSRLAMKEADVVFVLLDASQGLTDEDHCLMEGLPKKKAIVVWNKCDLQHPPLPSLSFPHQVSVSALTRQGISDLKQELDRVIWDHGPPSKEELILTSERHRNALQRSLDACEKVRLGLNSGLSAEFVNLDMRECLRELGTILGTDIGEDILSSIFSTFCVGK